MGEENNGVFDVHTVEVAMDMGRRLFLGGHVKAADPTVTAVCCLVLAHKYCQDTFKPVVRAVAEWLKDREDIAAGRSPLRCEPYREELQFWIDALTDMEVHVLEALDWSIVPQWTTMELLYLSGLLQDAPDFVVLDLENAVLHSHMLYRVNAQQQKTQTLEKAEEHKRNRELDESPLAAYQYLQQVRPAFCNKCIEHSF